MTTYSPLTEPDHHIDAFLSHLRAERGLSPNTVAAYQSDLSQLVSLVQNDGRAVKWDRVTQAELEEYGVKLRKRGYTESTTARKLAAVRSLFSFLTEEAIITSNPAQRLKARRPSRTLPDVLTEQEMVALLEAAGRKPGPEGARDRTMLELTYAAGLRVSEVVGPLGIGLGSVQMDAGWVRVMGKGSKERIVPLYPGIIDRLRRYVSEARPLLVTRGLNGRRARSRQTAMFLNARGKPLTRQGYWLILKHCGAQAKVGSRLSPHTLRHTFATHLLRGGASLRHVQELLGHANISTTQVYTHLTNEQVRETFEHAHPRA